MIGYRDLEDEVSKAIKDCTEAVQKNKEVVAALAKELDEHKRDMNSMNNNSD